MGYSMNDFIIGAAWMAGSISLGMIGAWTWNKLIDRASKEVGENIADPFISTRIASLESKVNLMTAFRKPGEGGK